MYSCSSYSMNSNEQKLLHCLHIDCDMTYRLSSWTTAPVSGDCESRKASRSSSRCRHSRRQIADGQVWLRRSDGFPGKVSLLNLSLPILILNASPAGRNIISSAFFTSAWLLLSTRYFPSFVCACVNPQCFRGVYLGLYNTTSEMKSVRIH